MTMEPEEQPREEGATESAERRFGPVLPFAVALLLVFAVGLLRLVLAGGHTTPLPAAKNVVVLIAPSTSLADWRDARIAPNLAALIRGEAQTAPADIAMGTMPNRRFWLPWRSDLTTTTLWSPITAGDLVRSCEALGGVALGKALQRDGVHATALGQDLAARTFLGQPSSPTLYVPSPLAAYDEDDVEQWYSHQPQSVGGFDTDPARLAAAITRVVAAGGTPAGSPALTVATFDDLLRSDAYAPLAAPEATAAQHQAAVGRLDSLIHALTQTSGPGSLPPATTLLVITPIASARGAAQGDALGPVLLWHRREGAEAGAPSSIPLLLTSPSTGRTPGLIAPPDMAATVLALLGSAPNAGAGRPAEIRTGSDAATYLPGRVNAWSAQTREARFLVALPWLCIGALILAALSSRSPEWRAALVVGVCLSPFALLLTGPLISPFPGREVIVYLAAGMLVLAAAGVTFWFTRSGEDLPLLSGVFLVTAALICLDLLIGGPLLSRSPLSYLPALGDRYYGIGNEFSGVFLGAALLTFTLGKPDALGAALGGLAFALVLGFPTLGADAGGFVAALAAFGTLTALIAGQRGNGRRAAFRVGGIALTVSLLLIALFLWGNAALPAGARTHVGQAMVGSVGGNGGRAALLKRKISTDARLLVTSPWSALLVTEIALCGWLWRRQRPDDPERPALIAAFVGAGALLLLNDSGAAAAATCLLYPTGRLLLPAKDIFFSDVQPEDGSSAIQ